MRMGEGERECELPTSEDCVEIVAGNDRVDIVVKDRQNGDVCLEVAVSSQGFAGTSACWVTAEALQQFLRQLEKLDESRLGEATLESMSPGELLLQIESLDRRGHVGVAGRRCFVGAASQPHAVEFGFEFDPTLLPAILAEFTELAADH